MANFRFAPKKVIYNTKTKFDRPAPKKFKSVDLKPTELLFDSKSEFEAYITLLKQEKEGAISNLQLQVPFLLVPKTTWYNNIKQKKEAVREMNYIADFVFERGGKKIICDCKGWKLKKGKWTVYVDDVYKIKKKLMLLMYKEYLFEEL